VAVKQAADLADEYAARIQGIYDRALLTIIEEMRTILSGGAGIGDPDWAREKAAEVATLRNWLKGQKLLADVPAELRAAVQQGYIEGGKAAAADLQAARLAAPEVEPYRRGARIKSFAKELTGMVTTTHPAILRQSVDAFRNVIAAGVGDVLTGTTTGQSAVQRALNEFADRGIAGFVDSAGKKWTLDSYATMAVRTGVMKASTAGKRDRFEASGEDLVIVSDHAESCPDCNEWEGRVLSLTGKTPGYPTLADAEAADLFHPNCRHELNLYTPGLTRPSVPQGGKTPEAEAALYKERMEQRRLERGVRQWKRRASAALDDAETAKARGKVQAWEGRLKGHIETVNKRRAETGEPPTVRMRYREQPMKGKPRG
jgi:hypothetical protein